MLPKKIRHFGKFLKNVLQDAWFFLGVLGIFILLKDFRQIIHVDLFIFQIEKSWEFEKSSWLKRFNKNSFKMLKNYSSIFGFSSLLEKIIKAGIFHFYPQRMGPIEKSWC